MKSALAWYRRWSFRHCLIEPHLTSALGPFHYDLSAIEHLEIAREVALLIS